MAGCLLFVLTLLLLLVAIAAGLQPPLTPLTLYPAAGHHALRSESTPTGTSVTPALVGSTHQFGPERHPSGSTRQVTAQFKRQP
jgi:hypothetical protein